MMDTAWILHKLQESTEVHRQLASPEQAEQVYRIAQAMVQALRNGNKIFFLGNGGSAAQAQHLAAELVGRFLENRAPLPALSLSTDTSALTAIGNDYGFEQVFVRQLQALAKPGDVVVALSTSGSSPNLLVAIEAARALGLTTVGLLGGAGGKLAPQVDLPLRVASASAPRVQECHLAIGHILCELVEKAFSSGETPSHSTSVPPQQRPASTKVIDWNRLPALRQHYKRAGKTMVWTNGCFDLLHVGHVRSLQAARALGDVLIVGLNSDASVRQLKGAKRPILPQAERAEMLAALECVNHVLVFEQTTPDAALAHLQPDIHCKGSDYAPPHGKGIPEAAVVQAYGGRIEFLPMVPDTSTTLLLGRIESRLSASAPEPPLAE